MRSDARTAKFHQLKHAEASVYQVTGSAGFQPAVFGILPNTIFARKKQDRGMDAAISGLETRAPVVSVA